MKVPPDHYEGPQATSKGHTPLLIPVTAMGKCKQANKWIAPLWSPDLINYLWAESAQFMIQGSPTLNYHIVCLAGYFVGNITCVYGSHSNMIYILIGHQVGPRNYTLGCKVGV